MNLSITQRNALACKTRLLTGSLLAALTAANTWAAPDANSAASYALRAPLALSGDAPLQRLVLPAQALVRLQTTGYSDVRIFNAQGQSVPMALAAVAAQTQTQNQQVNLPAYPILASSGSMVMEGLQLRIEEQQGKRVVQIDTASAPASAKAKSVVGVLLDARTVTAPVVAIVLDADLPVGQPITFDVQASKDLKNWRSLADTVLYRAADAADASANASASKLGTQRMQLPNSDLKDNYLRITWQGTTDTTTTVVVRGATLTTSQSTSSNPRVSAAIALPALTQAHELSFALPFVTPIAALKIKPQGNNVLIPVRVLGRNDRNQAWASIGSTVLYNLTTNGKEQSNAAVELGGVAYREIKIEADKKTAGFAALPEVSAQFEPTQIVFLASGNAPFSLAVGLADAVSAYLPLVSLMPGYQSGQENALPAARADISTAEVAAGSAAVAQATSNAPPTRSLVLWGVLLAGVVALGLMAWALMKSGKKPSESSE
jgi:Protein of unknown function (DUF3999)